MLRRLSSRRGDVGSDHIILDELMRIEPLARGDREDVALLVEHHPPLGQIELERRPFLARGIQRPRARRSAR